MEPDCPIQLISAGRTDAGVHARAMIANVVLDTHMNCDEIRDYMNRYLPDDIAIQEVREASDRFHARYKAQGKTYQYTLFDGPVKPVFNRKYYTYLDTPIDTDRMIAAAKILEGEHDWKSFCGNSRMKKSTVRNVDRIEVRRSKGYIYVTVHGTGFLQNMVRIIVGTLIEVGYGRMNPEDMETILEKKDRKLAGPTAPAKGLCLLQVDY
jgi:tRNA pseudouridine38-40 synthase